jgi:hypothetical protein
VGGFEVREEGPYEVRPPRRAFVDGEADRGLHGLPTLASQNHLFDSSTPTGSNYEANGAPGPPRDNRDISDLLDLFSF